MFKKKYLNRIANAKSEGKETFSNLGNKDIFKRRYCLLKTIPQLEIGPIDKFLFIYFFMQITINSYFHNDISSKLTK